MGAPRFLVAVSTVAVLCGCGFVGQRAAWEDVLPPQHPPPLLSDGSTRHRYDELFEYTVGNGDTVSVEVAGHREFSGPATIDQRGRMGVPSASDILEVEGLTLRDIEGKVALALSPYLLGKPEVHVGLLASRSKRYYVLGGVTHPGLYSMGANVVRLREALAGAGFVSEFRGDDRRVGIITPDETEPTYVIANGRDLLKGDDKFNIVIKSGDIIFVQDRLIYDVDGFLFVLFRETENVSTTNKAVKFWEEAANGEFGDFTYPRQGLTIIY